MRVRATPRVGGRQVGGRGKGIGKVTRDLVKARADKGKKKGGGGGFNWWKTDDENSRFSDKARDDMFEAQQEILRQRKNKSQVQSNATKERRKAVSRQMKGIDKPKPPKKIEYDEPEGSIPIPLASFGIPKYDGGERFDLRGPYVDEGYVDAKAKKKQMEKAKAKAKAKASRGDDPLKKMFDGFAEAVQPKETASASPPRKDKVKEDKPQQSQTEDPLKKMFDGFAAAVQPKETASASPPRPQAPAKEAKPGVQEGENGGSEDADPLKKLFGEVEKAFSSTVDKAKDTKEGDDPLKKMMGEFDKLFKPKE
eukprot:CAMPEP_0198247112 /NCGR_PEP_ID=MMETSP1446-20131203/46314_1 /TAXON_ID=1461542 ORGANISM="Unidentified sp, Strain CCMP2111" /NCGR_SAMPLE_ID=MMETSP1446 /ASSEMBLY_ACC=CAM_ASM_001112 /LENGTH=309 /DNA_ID=CAMNT_0043931437 /DNA_START=106 /DNA_END=1035 /DNA_ORIENTATION=-